MICLLVICYQDFTARLVYWFLFPFIGIILGTLHYMSVTNSFFLYSVFANTLLVFSILSILYLYAKFFMKKHFLNHSLGLGDILFFFALGVGFPTITFVILFVYSIFFSLFIFLVLKRNLKLKTIPLAGLMSMFFIMVFLTSLFYDSIVLYSI